ncbi:MAG: hypothetical protein LBD70_03345, partial [Bifidobacteriaceae bacterium]|nr:hypothetical protein [Bifidobacteriaceae bacterium]
RALANLSLRAAQWARRRGETAAIRATAGDKGLAVVVTALVRSAATWKAVLYLLVNALLLPAHLAALAIFPLAGLWARADAWFTVRLLGAAPGPVPAPDADRSAAAFRPASGQAGFGLAGMAERVAALGGRLATGPTDDGGFMVRAVLPLAPQRAQVIGRSGGLGGSGEEGGGA